jgi:predicted nucleic acid-binding protein
MIFGDIPAGASVFLDANIFIYAFGPDPTFGPACDQLLDRIARQEIQGFTSAHVLSDVAHRLMTLEACATFGWSMAGIARRLKRHPTQIQVLARHCLALDEINLVGVQVLPTSGPHVSLAADLSRQLGLLSSDALLVTVMRDCGLSLLASHDSDFDRVPGITRYAPV